MYGRTDGWMDGWMCSNMYISAHVQHAHVSEDDTSVIKEHMSASLNSLQGVLEGIICRGLL